MFLLIFIVLPVLEILAFVEVGLAIGWPWAVLLLLGTSIIGYQMARRHGRVAFGEVSRAFSERRPPRVSALDGAMGSFAGLLLFIPGFVTDLMGAVLLLPPARKLVRTWISTHYGGRAFTVAASAGRFVRGTNPRRPADVESTAVEEDLRQLPL
jgi:UPF0716 protein FxsA